MMYPKCYYIHPLKTSKRDRGDDKTDMTDSPTETDKVGFIMN